MSTRGTYLVRIRKYNQDGCPNELFDVCFYRHSDNYLEGAAELFEEALALTWPYQVHGMNMAKRMAAVPGTEFIHSHDDHADTEYRYNITENKKEIWLEVFQRADDLSFGKNETWTNVFNDNIEIFIDRYAP